MKSEVGPIVHVHVRADNDNDNVRVQTCVMRGNEKGREKERTRVVHASEPDERGRGVQKWDFDFGKHRRDDGGLLERAPSLTQRTVEIHAYSPNITKRKKTTTHVK